MPSVADLVDEEALRRLAGGEEPLERARAAADAGRVELRDFGPLAVRASVEDAGEVHEVALGSTADGLEWSCTCPEGSRGIFCAHAAAAGIEAWRRSPPRRRPA